MFGFLPFSYLVYIYEIGNRRFDKVKYENKIEKNSRKYDNKIASTSKKRRISRLNRKKNSLVDELTFKKENGNWLMQIGEPLAVFDSSKTYQSIDYFNNYLISNGYFDHEITHEVIKPTRNKVFNNFHINAGNRYIIDSIVLDYPDSSLYNTIFSYPEPKQELKNSPYTQDKLENRRDFIYQALTNSGYFTFSKQYIKYEIDTFSLQGSKILLTEKILNPTSNQHLPYTIDSIQFISSSPSESKARKIFTSGKIKFQFEGIDYSTDILSRNILIKTDSLYSKEKTLNTQMQLSYLDAFKFVNINYDSLGNQRLLANIFTSPLKKYQSSLEFGAISGVSGSQQIPGPFLNVGLINRNVFNSLDVIDLQGNFSIQGISNVENAATRYSLIQYGAALGFTLPKFLMINNRKLRSNQEINNTQTRFQLAYNFENRTTEYQRATAEFSYSYLWRSGNKKRYNFSPFTFSYIDVPAIQYSFEQFLIGQDTVGNGALRAAFNSSVISSSSFDILFNSKENSSTSENSFLRLFMETGGNLINLLGENFFLTERQEQLQTSSNRAGFSFFRWTKVNIDYRKVIPLNDQTDLAYRINLGVAIPYGEKPALPYLKRFYIGGSNSLRAWQVRRLGPGSFGDFNNLDFERQDIDLVNYQTEQGGDMVIEASLEFRRNLIGFIDYALFADVGNVWLINTFSTQTDNQGDDGFFRFDRFWREFAIGAGLGLRLDFSFFVFRIDGAVQVHDPAQLRGNRWVIGNIPFSQIGNNLSRDERSILQNKTNITLGIGLPF